jgi:hypothetical protein
LTKNLDPVAGLTQGLLTEIGSSLGFAPETMERLSVCGVGSLPSMFPITDLAAAVIGSAGLAIAALSAMSGMPDRRVRVDRRLASLWFGWSVHPVGWRMPAPWDPIAGDYHAADGWIRLHTNAPHHRAAALNILGCANERHAVTEAVATWQIDALEAAIVDAGGCAAAMRSRAAWDRHPQGIAIAAEPLIGLCRHFVSTASSWQPHGARPLAGLKVLDLTRVLAGPIATRFLAGFGADVLRIDPPDWDEPGVVPEVTLGKRCARLNLRRPEDRSVFEGLLAKTDVLVHGYRPGALDGLGYGEAVRRSICPDLIDVTLDAYGWSGPWASRRGFDSLVQMSAGIADAGMAWKRGGQPVPLPVQALDHATGYLLAAATVCALTARLLGEGAATIRLSLARTAKLLADADRTSDDEPFAGAVDADLASAIEQTAWGPARRCTSPIMIDDIPMGWSLPASALGSSEPRWCSACNASTG